MRLVPILLLIGPLLGPAAATAGDDPASKKPTIAPTAPARKSALAPAVEFDAARELDALAFVRTHHAELATVLESLKPMDPAEYRKAIAELSQVARNLAELEARNPRRHELALEGWKARSRVELLAAQLTGSPNNEEARSQLRTAIEAKVSVEIARQRYELEQAESAAKKARESLDRLETHRDAIIEARFRALQPKKLAKSRKPAATPKAEAPKKPDPTSNAHPNGEDRR